jgi:hypothetical protein
MDSAFEGRREVTLDIWSSLQDLQGPALVAVWVGWIVIAWAIVIALSRLFGSGSSAYVCDSCGKVGGGHSPGCIWNPPRGG